MTGQQLYALWQDAMAREHINTREWEKLPDRLRSAWNATARFVETELETA